MLKITRRAVSFGVYELCIDDYRALKHKELDLVNKINKLIN